MSKVNNKRAEISKLGGMEAYRKRTKPREYTYEDIYVTTGEFIRGTCPF